MVRTDVLNRADGAGQKFARALTGAWYEMLAQMSDDKVLTAIAEGSQDTLASYKEQLSTTKMFYTPKAAADFTVSPDLKQKMALVRQFCFDHGLLGANTKSVDDVAINIPMAAYREGPTACAHFRRRYMQMAGGKVVDGGRRLHPCQPGRLSATALSWFSSPRVSASILTPLPRPSR